MENFGFKSGAEKFPLMVVTSFTYVCNARCPNCPYTNSDIRKNYVGSMHISEGVFKRIADECGRYGAYIRLTGGGEPMLHPRAVEFMEYAKCVGAKIGLITNGSRFSDESLTRIMRINTDVVEFSVDAGDEETYNTVRPGLSWETLVNNVMDAARIRKEVGSETKIIVSAIDQKGVDVEKVKSFWSDKVDNVQIRKYLTWGINDDHAGDKTPYLKPEDMIPCPWLFERLNIDSKGDVTFCGEDIRFKYKFANIMDRSILDIWTGEEFTVLRNKHLLRTANDAEMCLNCPDWKYRSWEHNYWKVIK